MKVKLALAGMAATTLISTGFAFAAQALSWIKTPNQNDYEAVFPKAAAAAGVDGKATIHCTVTPQGQLTDCGIVSESPAGYNFGAAALALTPIFQANPAPTARTVTIPVNFQTYSGRKSYTDQMRASLEAQGVDVDKLIQGLNENDQQTLNLLRDRHIDPDQMRQALGLAPESRTDQSTVRLWNNPVWLQAPSQADLAAAWPRLSDADGGTATIQCLLQDNGTLKSCQIASEQPHGQSIGTAAVNLAKLFKANMAASPGGGLAVQLSFHLLKPGHETVPPPQVNQPVWTATPNAAAISAAFPAEARTEGVTRGMGYMRCTVRSGALTDCQPVGSNPAGPRFGMAALPLASLYRIGPWIQGVGPSDGASVLVSVNFVDPAPTAMPLAPAPRSPPAP